jgi:hypothetical protein
MKQLVYIFLLLSLNSFSQSQTLHYSIVLKDDPIGTMNATRIIQKDHVSYLIESHILIDKIIRMKIDYTITAEFHSGKLVKSSTRQEANGKLQVNTSTKWNGNYYSVNTLTGNTKLKEKIIDYNLCSLYFYEPEGRKKIYSDSFGKFIPISIQKNHRYKLQLPEGKENIYDYNYGICSMVEMEQLFSKVRFVLVK